MMGQTHILLEVSQTPEVLPPGCPHSSPGLDLREKVLPSEHQAETHAQTPANAIGSRATRRQENEKSALRVAQEEGATHTTTITLMIASMLALKYCSRSW